MGGWGSGGRELGLQGRVQLGDCAGDGARAGECGVFDRVSQLVCGMRVVLSTLAAVLDVRGDLGAVLQVAA